MVAIPYEISTSLSQAVRTVPLILLQTFTVSNKLVLKVYELKTKRTLEQLAPARLIVKVNIRPFFVVVGCNLRLLVPLKPGHVLLVEPPRVLLELFRRQVLLKSPLLIVESKEEGVRREAFEQGDRVS